MAIFNCKRCGEPLDILSSSKGICECKVCGAQQTIPIPTSEKIDSLHGSAAQARKMGDFDGARILYNQILAESPDDPEVYWSIVLCKYGVQYVIEAGTNKRVPTVNRTQITSVFDDDHYKLAIQHATDEQKTIYESDAKEIDEIQKGILEISAKEDPFDIFICYKESEEGIEPKQRTVASVRAEEIYDALTKEGFKVFFSRITLEDKLGVEYEPYIFSALNSSKVMLVFGTKAEHFSAPWVRNEWSRYIGFINAKQKDKHLIAVYEDPSHLPREFSSIQSQDMTKIGWNLDLVRGVKKFLGAPIGGGTVINKQEIINLIKQGERALETGDFDAANKCAEAVLEKDAENYDAYIIKFLVEFKIKKLELLKTSSTYIGSSFNYLKACQYAPDDQLKKLHRFEKATRENSNVARANALKLEAEKLMDKELYYDAIKLFESAVSYNPNLKIDDKLKACRDHFNSKYYDVAMHSIEDEDYARAITYLKLIGDYSDSKKKLVHCEKMMNEVAYKAAVNLMDREAYSEAIKAFEKIADYKDSAQKIRQCKDLISEGVYKSGVALMTQGAFNDATSEFEKITNYKDAEKRIRQCRELAVSTAYKNAVSLMKDGYYSDAIAGFEKVADYKNASKLIGTCKRAIAAGKGPKKKKTKGGGGVYKKKRPLWFLRLIVYAAIVLAFIGGYNYLDQNGYLEPDIYIYEEFDGTIVLQGVTGGISENGVITVPHHIKGIPVTRIDNGAFESTYNLVEVIVPEGITSIGANAFANCTQLTHITLASSLVQVSDSAFEGSNSIEFVQASLDVYTKLPAELRESLRNVVITEAEGALAPELFARHFNLQSVSLCEGITDIGQYAFAACSNLSSIKIPSSVVYIGEGAFKECTGLSTLEIGANVTTIKEYAFYGCYNITTLSIPNGDIDIAENAFSSLPIMYASVHASILPRLSLGSNLNSVTVTGGDIPSEAFSGCYNLEAVIINDGVTSIGNRAFANCSSITSIEIPSSVTAIGSDAFYNCPIRSAKLPLTLSGAIGGTLEGVTLTGDGVLAEDAFKGCTSLTSVTFEGNVTEIGAGAFEGCTSITSFSFPQGLKVIGDGAFRYCSGLFSLNLPSSLETIGAGAFFGCSQLTRILIPESVTVIGSAAFANCSELYAISCGATSQPDTWASDWTDNPAIVTFKRAE